VLCLHCNGVSSWSTISATLWGLSLLNHANENAFNKKLTLASVQELDVVSVPFPGSHRGAEVHAVPQLAEQRRKTSQEGSGTAAECGAML
jgi:hypothetical protein